jgi:uncharacterized membrane protein
MSTREPLPPSEEARIHHMSALEEEEHHAPGRPSPWDGWVTFAALVLVMLGCINGFQGVLALFDEGYFVARGSELVLLSYDAWGAVLIIWGIVLLLVGAGLNARREWARWAAIVVVMLDVILQVGFLPSSPLLALFLITLDVIVMFALTARWDEARSGRGVLG